MLRTIKVACAMLLAWCSPADAQFQWVKVYDNNVTPNFSFEHLFFTNDSTGYAAGGNGSIGGVIYTTDRGATWSPPFYVGKQIKYIFFPTDSVGFAVGDNEIYKTTNAGQTWNTNATFSSNVFLGCIYFFDKDTGIAFMENTGNGLFPYFITNNGGSSWQSIYTDTILARDADFPSRNTGYAGIAINRTTDGGQNWTRYPAPFNTISGIDFISDSVGYAAGVDGGSSPCNTYGVLAKTIDAGQTWDTLLHICSVAAYDVTFPTQTRGYTTFGMAGVPTVMVTQDAGNTWAPSIVDSTGGAFNIFCTDSNTCYVSTNLGIFKTVNGGGVGINQSIAEQIQVSVYPNPFTSSTTFDIKSHLSSSVDLLLFDELGQQVRHETFTGNKFELFREGLSRGIYFYMLQEQTGKTITRGKLIVQ